MAKPRKRAERLTRRDVIWITITVVILVLVTALRVARLAGGPGLAGLAACVGALAPIVCAAFNRE